MNTKIVEVLNQQVSKEFAASNHYLDIAVKLDSNGFAGGAQFFYAQAEEERMHAMKILDYIIERDQKVSFGSMQQVNNDSKTTLRIAFKNALDSEKKITASVEDIVKICNEEGDYMTLEFMRFFLAEQREEESTMKAVIDKLEIIGNDKAGLYQLDNELGSGTFRNEANPQ